MCPGRDERVEAFQRVGAMGARAGMKARAGPGVPGSPGLGGPSPGHTQSPAKQRTQPRASQCPPVKNMDQPMTGTMKTSHFEMYLKSRLRWKRVVMSCGRGQARRWVAGRSTGRMWQQAHARPALGQRGVPAQPPSRLRTARSGNNARGNSGGWQQRRRADWRAAGSPVRQSPLRKRERTTAWPTAC